MIARLALVLMALVIFAAPSVAQSATNSNAPVAAAAAPQISASATAMRQHASAVDTLHANAAAARKNVGKPIALMIVGGAAIVVGALIGGDVGTIFMVGGAVMGLIGLYQYLQ